jgi:DNA topoisomerase-1
VNDSIYETEQCQKLYNLIWKRSIESCMSDYIYNNIAIKITAPISWYNYEIDIPLFLGWKYDIIKNDIIKTKNINQNKTNNNIVKLGEEQTKKNGLLLFLQSAKSPIKCMKIECGIHMKEINKHYTEAGLIRELEEYGIGRPSTFSLIINTIQSRNYVIKKDIEGDKIKCVEFSIDFLEKGNHDHDPEIIRTEKERIFGNEKNKLVLQELGKLVIETLIPTFNDLFSYDYTKKMEIELDKISNGENTNKWSDICKDCDETIKQNTKEWKQEMKTIYKIDNEHELIFMKTGAVIRKITNSEHKNPEQKEEYEYKRIKSNIQIDFQKLRNKEYNLEELLEISNEYLGEYENTSLYLKNGQYGLYVVWGDKKESIKLESINVDPNKKIEEITMDDIISYLQIKSEKKRGKLNTKTTLRILNERISIRKGKYGPYIHYVIPEKEGSPQFYNLKLFPENYLNCEINVILKWLENTYGIV